MPSGFDAAGRAAQPHQGLGAAGIGLADVPCQLDVTRDLIDEQKGGYYTPLPT
ncbi:hypothetical protein [Streptomyces sp. NPDC093970]|uniref:hypothetical protein n=1 Tax=Streptomyces sp. NPDC093970 TaxID=3155076 RepID=UPI003416D6FA